MAQPEAVTDETTERRMADAAHVLLDVCNAAIPADRTTDRKGQSIALAVQAICMVDHLEPGKPVEERGRHLTGDEMMRIFYALGRGVGDVIGAIPDPTAQVMAANILSTGAQQAIERRAAWTREMLRKGK